MYIYESTAGITPIQNYISYAGVDRKGAGPIGNKQIHSLTD